MTYFALMRILISLAVALLLVAQQVGAQSTNVLVFTKTAGYRHASIEHGVAVLQQLGDAYRFEVTHTEDSTQFRDATLATYDVVVFLSTTGDVLGPDEEAAFERFIQEGGGFVGIHAAADTEYDWPFYRELVGRQFVQHPEHQRGRIHTVPSDFPEAMTSFGDSLTLYEEGYEYTVPYAVGLQDLMRIDTSTYNTRAWLGQERMGVYHPLAWYHEHAGGRAFYTGIGHMDDTFDLPAFQDHLVSAIHWAATGEKRRASTLR